MPRSVVSKQAPKPAGFYSQAVVANDLVFVSGQLPVEAVRGPRTPEEPLPSVEDQTTQCLMNIDAILAAAFTGPGKIVRCTVYVSDVGLWPKVNEAYQKFFEKRTVTPPARTVVPCGQLHFGYQVEIDCIAVLKDNALR